MKIVKKIEGISLPIVLMSSALLLVITAMISVLVISEVGSFNRVLKTKKAYALAKEGIQIGVANINNGMAAAGVNAIQGTTGESGPNDIYQVTSWNQNSRVLTVQGRAQVRNETDCRLDVNGDGRDEYFVCKSISTKLIRDPDTFQVNESFSTENNRDNAVAAGDSPIWDTQNGSLVLEQIRVIPPEENVYQDPRAASNKHIKDLETWNGRLWATQYVYNYNPSLSDRRIYSSDTGDQGAWQQEFSGFESFIDLEVYNGDLYSIQSWNQQSHPYGRLRRKSSSENFAQIRYWSAQFDAFRPNRMAVYNGKLYIVGEGYRARRVWSYDGTNTVAVRAVGGTSTLNMYTTAMAFNGKLYVGGSDNNYSSIIAIYDGSSWQEMIVGSGMGRFTEMHLFNGRLYASRRRIAGYFFEVWSTADGTNWQQTGQIPDLGGAYPDNPGALEVYNGMLYTGDGTPASRGKKAIHESADGMSWSNYKDFPSSGAVMSLKVFNACLYGGTYMTGIIYRVCDFGVATYQNRTAAGVINVPTNNIREIKMTIYPAEGSDGSLNNFMVSANGGAWATDNAAVLFNDQPVTNTFTGMANGADSNIRYQFGMLSANGAETPLVDHVKIEYIAGEPYKIDYSSWRAD